MDKEFILEEIRQNADSQNVALGERRFYKETNIKKYDLEEHWVSLSEAVLEADCIPNEMSSGYPEEVLLEHYALLARKLGKLPTENEINFESRNDAGFPTSKTFRKLGRKPELIEKLVEFCRIHDGYEDIAKLCKAYSPPKRKTSVEQDLPEDGSSPQGVKEGYVYMLKMGCVYYIGKSNHPGRRNYEHGKKLPEPVETVHEIKTDDMDGIERYWQERFANKQTSGGGDWFELNAADVRAFKSRRKLM